MRFYLSDLTKLYNIQELKQLCCYNNVFYNDIYFEAQLHFCSKKTNPDFHLWQIQVINLDFLLLRVTDINISTTAEISFFINH